MSKRVVIVGGVAAGMKTAARLRRLDAEAEIIVLERGPQLSYGACGFPYFISGEVKSMDSFDHTPQGALRDSNYFAAVKGIDARCGCNVQKIDRVQKCVHYMEKGELKQLSYDVLVLATGSTPVKLPLPNADAAGIHSFWFPWDVEAVDKEIAEGGVKDVVIIGAGFIGLELAEAFVRRSLHTSVLEQQDRLLPQLLDEDMAALLLRDTKNPLLDIYLEERAGAFTVENGKVSGVQTDKRVIPAQLVIVAVGVRPNVELAREAGLVIGPSGCIAVNEYLQTSDDAIYAGGDCAENTHRVSGAKVFVPMGSTANKHGRVIADNICGARKQYPGVLGTAVCRFFEQEAGATGLNERTARQAGIDFASVVVPGSDRLGYMPGVGRIVLKLLAEKSSGRVLGAQAVGASVAKRIDTLAAAISLGATLEDLSGLDLAYAPPFNTPIENIATAANVLQNKLDGQLRSINPVDFEKNRTQEDYLFVDVRTPAEVAAKRIADIPSRVNLPLDTLRTADISKMDKEQKIVTACQIDLRGYEAEVILRARGFHDVYSLEGGMSGWPYATESDNDKK
ncbi:FAD-dependent oxidoreductase [Phascolarctobacterium succinatutens]|uniref:FAD-dependent oxidoreductase n=1 Tax=Phascolarctobacterium succinatutens TaxID=626940 RepID=UPI003AF142CE